MKRTILKDVGIGLCFLLSTGTIYAQNYPRKVKNAQGIEVKMCIRDRAYVKWLYDLCIICFADIRISNDFGYNKKGREYILSLIHI